MILTIYPKFLGHPSAENRLVIPGSFPWSTKGVRSYDSKLQKNPDVVKTTQTSNPVAFKKWHEFLCLCWFVVFSKSIHNTSNLNFQLGLDGCLPESSNVNKSNSKTGLLQNETFLAGILDEPTWMSGKLVNGW